ncbi:MAG: NUDIX domain-containing protein [Gammaproteobacteria bacterium]|nr:NUDIX domain-containing protein [Gammaproteobacteria bacterium]
MNKKYEILECSTLLNDFLTVKAYRLKHDLFSGGQSHELRRLRLEKEKAVSVLLFDPDNNAVVMVEQFRIGAREMPESWLLENPAGYVEQGESSEDVAVREVREETGCELSALTHICEFLVSPGISNERIDLYCGRVDSSNAAGIHGLDHEGEDIRVEVLTLKQAKSELYSGRINSTSTIISMQWLLLQLASGRQLFSQV